MAETDKGPWDLGLEVIGILMEPGCGWNYKVGFKTAWDGRHFPEGMCPFAWNAFSPWIWALRYGGSNEPLGYQSEDEMTFVCPDTRHMIVWRIQRIKDESKSVAGPLNIQRGEAVRKLKIEVDEVKRTKQVSEIVESDFFQDLQAKARSMRSRRGPAQDAPGDKAP